MSLYNVLRTGVSGMEAQSTKLSTVSENIANANTVGYKRADTEFSSLILDSGPSSYSSGAVKSNIRHEVSKQGTLSFTQSKTDVAVQGDGFFVVEDTNGGRFLTRSGSFVLDGKSGTLVNAAGYSLLGLPSQDGQNPAITLNDTAGLEPISLEFMDMRANPSNTGTYRANLDSEAPVVTGDTPGDNVAGSTFTAKNSVVAYDDLGKQITLDVYWTKTAANTWEVSVFNQAEANIDPTNNFPYEDPPGTASGPLAAPSIVEFDPSTGAIDTLDGTAVVPEDPAQRAILDIDTPGAVDDLSLDITGMTQLAADFEPLEVSINGNAPARVQDILIENDGKVYAEYEDGAKVEFYRLPLANVASADQLDPRPGNVYGVTPASGDVRVALPDQSGNGSLVVGAVEQSNVDLATELTEMIISQRSYTANSRSFQTGSDLLEVLVNLAR